MIETQNAQPLTATTASPRAPERCEQIDIPAYRIEARRGTALGEFAEVWRFRDLLYFLTLRDIKVRYKQTVLGAAWAILQPVLTMVVFSVFFGHFAGMSAKTGGVPYPIYVFAALLPWTFFANALTGCASSLVGSYNLITKVYFPRLIIPAGTVFAGLVDLGLALLVLLGMMAWYHVPVTLEFALLPLAVVGVTVIALGVGTMLAAMTVSYRDFRYIVPFLTQIWMFVTPVIYPTSIVPSKARILLDLNPLTGLIGVFRSAVLGRPIEWTQASIALGLAVVSLYLGMTYFRSVERRFADVI